MKSFAVFAVYLLVFAPWPALGGEECDRLLEVARENGESPTISIDQAGGSVEIRASRGGCRESVGDWLDRQLVMAPGRDGGAPTIVFQAKDFQAPRQIEIPMAQAGGAARCDRQLAGMFAPLWLNLGPFTYWLDRVFTIDRDGDGTTDNLGFIIKRRDGPDATLYYLAPAEDIAAASLPELQIDPDVELSRICFGDLNLAPPPDMPTALPTGPRLDIAPDLAGQVKQRAAPAQETVAPPVKKKESRAWIWWVGGLGMAVIGAGVGIGMWITRRRRRIMRRRKKLRAARRLESQKSGLRPKPHATKR